MAKIADWKYTVVVHLTAEEILAAIEIAALNEMIHVDCKRFKGINFNQKPIVIRNNDGSYRVQYAKEK